MSKAGVLNIKFNTKELNKSIKRCTKVVKAYARLLNDLDIQSSK
jgi:hypothetical protein